MQHTVLAGQCLLSKQCVPLLSLLGQCDTVLGQISLNIFYLACQIKKLRCPKSFFGNLGGKIVYDIGNVTVYWSHGPIV